MSVAFRIRTSAGQELSFASRASFEDFVRSGDLSPDDLVYDGETGSWSPSRTHPIVLEIEYEAEAEAEREAAAVEAEGDGGAEGADGGDDSADGEAGREAESPSDAEDEAELGLSLAPVQEAPPPKEEDSYVDGSVPEIERPAPTLGVDAGAEDADDDLDLDLTPESDVSPEEASQAFVEKLEAERAASFDFGAGSTAGGAVRMENRGSMGEMITPASETTAPRDEKPLRPRREPARPAPSRAPAPAPGRSRLGLVAILLLVAAGSYFGYTQFAAEPGPEAPPNQPVDPIPVDPTPTPDPTPAIPSAEVDVRDRARERFLTATQRLIRDLPSVPETWVTAEYFVRPTDYPDIVPVWEGYLVAIRNVRAQDRQRYTTAYNGALDDARITGEERGERLSAALAGFDSVAARREAHYDRVEALASAAIQSHGVLVDAEGLLLTDAIAEGGAGGLGAGVSGRDADAQLLLDQVVEVLAARLSAGGLGPRTPENVREWIWDGYLRAVTTPD